MVTAMTIAAIRNRAEKGQSVETIRKALKLSWPTVKKYATVLKVKETPSNGTCIRITCPSPEHFSSTLNRIFSNKEFSAADKADLLGKLYKATEDFEDGEKTDEEFPPDEN